MKLFSVFITLLFLIPGFSVAQNQVRISLFPGYLLINSDKPAVGDDASKTDWVFGGNVSLTTEYRGLPIEVAVGYSEGNSTVYTYFSTAEHLNPPSFDIDLRYRTLPVEAFYRHQISEGITLLGGLNMTAQHRVLQYDESFNVPNDRLLSFGIGLSGIVRADFFTFSSGNGSVFGSVSSRYTEFLIHHANGRNLDDFTMRHLTLSPEIGVHFKMGAPR